VLASQDPSFQLWELALAAVSVAQEIEIGTVLLPSKPLTSPPTIILTTAAFEPQLLLTLTVTSPESEVTVAI
jgi:hypothetical protein